MSDWREADRLDVHGVLDKGVFRPGVVELHRPPGPPETPLIALGRNLVASAQLRAFGIEERTETGRENGTINVTCRPGNSPAGVTIRWPTHRFPRRYSGRWMLAGRTDAPIGVAAVKDGDDVPAEGAIIWTGGAIAVPVMHAASDQMLVLTCPSQGVSARIDALVIGAGEEGSPVRSRGTWIWREQDWSADPIGFADKAARAGWTEMAVQAPAGPTPALARLAGALMEKGITFRLLDGDPAMATAEGLNRALARLRALRRWCDEQLGRLHVPTLELDIEPYSGKGFGTDPASGWRGWAIAVKAIAAAWGRPVAVDVPWWMHRSPGGTAALADVGNSVAEIVVMAYRTDVQLILDAAEPWLAGGKRAIRIAVETGPVSPEITRAYRRAPRGTLRVRKSAVELLSSPDVVGSDEAMFELVGESVTDPARVSFHASRSAVDQAERALVPLLQGWSSFAGFRIHGWPEDRKD